MTPAQNITRHFGGEWQGNQGAFPTPGHSSSDRGMTVKDADNGEVVFYCHNGDDAAWRGLKDECRQLGLLPQRQRVEGSAWRETGRYEYVDQDGAVLYRTLRIEKAGERKQFRAQRPDGRGGWTNGLDKAAPRILYHLPDILAAELTTVIYLTEGERKADKLASWGFVATAIAFGAKGWRDAYAHQLAGRTVVILPDNDSEGRGFAERAAASIERAGGRPIILDLPDLPAKGDIIDWRGSPDDLRRLTASAVDTPPATAEPLVAMLPLIDPGAWQGVRAPDRTWAWHEWIAAVAHENAANDLFERCLSKCHETRRAVSHVNGINYAPRIFAGMPEARGTTQTTFERAMERLIHNGTVLLDQELWKGDNRHWKRGMKLARKPGESAPTPALTPAPTHAPTPRRFPR